MVNTVSLKGDKKYVTVLTPLKAFAVPLMVSYQAKQRILFHGIMAS